MRESPTAAKAYALLKKAVLKRVSIGCDDVKSKVVEIKRFHKLAPSVRFFWPPGRTRCRVNERYGDVTSTTEFARGSDSSIGQLSLPSLSMSHGLKSDDWMQKVHESQRNTVFPDTARNFGGFWGGLYRQKLNAVQSAGLLVLVVFYIAWFVALIGEAWPRGPEPFWEKILHGYGLYFLMSLPLVLFFPSTSQQNASHYKAIALTDPRGGIG